MGAYFLKRASTMRPKWTKVGNTTKDLFDIIDLLKKGVSIVDIVQSDNSVTVSDIQQLLLRMTEYLKKHLILDSYLETVNKISPAEITELKLEWSKNETNELIKLYASGAKIENIAILMRKNKIEVQEKIKSLNFTDERKNYG